MTGPLWWASIAGASLLGSLHCAGMCGPFVAVYVGGRRGAGESGSLGHLGYHAGRLLTYTGLGAVAGAVGGLVDFAFDRAGWVQSAALVTSVLLIVAGLWSILPRRWIPLRRLQGARFLERAPRTLVKLGTKPRVVRGALLGLFTPLLPCGWLYAFVLVAAGTGSALQGALALAVFWAGTVPALLGLGFVLSRLGERLRPRLPVLLGSLWIVVGLVGVAHRSRLSIELRAPSAAALTDTAAGAAPTPGVASTPGATAHCH